MASTIQTIETPKRARALDTSSGWQVVSPELIASNAANNRTFDSGVGDWIVYDGDHPDDTAIANASNKLQVTTTVDDADEGAQLPIVHVGDGSTTSIVAGRSYRVSMDLDLTTPGSGTFAMRMTFAGDTSSSFDITTTETTYTKDFVAQNNTGGLFIYNTSSTDTVFTVDNVSVKEIRHFPNNNHGQIYSGRGLEFDGVTDYLDTPIKFDSTNFTFAAWVNAEDNGTNKIIIDCRDGSNDGINLHVSNDAGEKIKLGLDTTDIIGSTVVAGKWVRVVATYDGSTANIYVNGVLDGTGSASETFSADTKTLRIGRKAYGASNHMTGLMSDIQVWTTAWTADDVSYDYLNPESIVLNRGGTSLTNSNLKLWYPMQDSHRGQQSYVLDASNTGLGDNILVNPTFDTSINIGTAGSGWSDDSTGGSSASFSGGGGKLLSNGSDIVRLRAKTSDGTSSNVVVSGVTYKLTYDVIENNGVPANKFSYYDGSNTVAVSEVEGSYELYYTAKGTVFQFQLTDTGVDSGDYIIVDNAYLYPVNDKNHATTVFYGDEMWDANDHTVGWTGRQHIIETTDREFTAASSWVAYGTGTTLGDDGSPTHLEVTGTTSTSAQGVELSGRRHKRWIKGQQYRISAKIWWNSDPGGSGIGSVFYFKLGGTNSSSFAVTATSRGTVYTADITAVNNTGSILIYYMNASTEQWNVDDVSVVQIGTPIGGTNDGVSLPYVGHTASHGAYIHLSDAEKLNSDLTIGRKYRLSGLFATDVAGTVNAPEVAVLTNAEDTWYYDATQSTVPATNLIQNPGFETAGGGGADIWANWTEVAGSGTLANDTSNEHNGDDCASLTTVSTNTCNIHQSVTVTAGTTYLVSYWSKSGHASDSGSLRHRVLNASDSDSAIIDSTYSGNTTTDWRQTVFQFTAPTGCTSAKLVLMSPASNYTALADDVLVTAFLEKNIDFTASTTDSDYLAHKNKAMSDTDCMIYRKASSYINQDFTGVSTNWIAYNISSITLDTSNDNLDFTTTSDNEKEGASLDVGYFEPLEIGRWYTVVVTLSSNTGTPTVYVDVGGAESHGRVISTTPTEYAFTVGPVSSVTGTLKVYTEETDGYTITMDDVQLFENCTLYYDDISLKEIGTASGWTDADQQLHIPQTALQSYNELLYNFSDYPLNGTEVTIDHHDALDVGTGDFSISLWFRWDGGGSSHRNIISKGGWGSAGYSIGLDSSDRIALNLCTGVGNNRWAHTTSTTTVAGKWYHVVGVWDRSDTQYLYINGEIQTMGGYYDINDSPSTGSLDNTTNFKIYKRSSSSNMLPGCTTEIALFKGSGAVLSQAEVNELYNDGKALDATTHSKVANLKGYWRNNGLSTWKNLILTSTTRLLNEALTDSEADVNIDSGHGFVVNDVMVVGNEEMLITAIPSTNTMTVTRGYNNTVATEHNDDSPISIYKNGTAAGSETLLITQGLDNRDSQGFTMNKPRNTSSLNLSSKTSTGAMLYGNRVEAVPFTDLIADGASTASMECWVKANGTAGSDDYCTFAGERTSKNVLLCGRTSTNRPAAVYRLSSSGNINTLESTADNIFDGDWHHVAFTFGDGDGVAKLYIDGTQSCPLNSDTQTHAGETLDNDHALFYVGGGDAGQDRYFNGMVDGVRVYSNALSAGEVKRNYNATKGSHRN